MLWTVRDSHLPRIDSICGFPVARYGFVREASPEADANADADGRNSDSVACTGNHLHPSPGSSRKH